MNTDTKKFEKDVLTFLQLLGVKVVSYYTYPYHTDIIAYLKPDPPFTLPTKLIVEIVLGKPSEEMIESFVKLAKDSLAQKALVFSPIGKQDLGPRIISVLDKHRVEFLDGKQVASAIAKEESPTLTSAQMKKIYEVFSAPMLAKYLPDIALQIIPKPIATVVSELDLKPWQVFEQVVFSIFNYCFGFTVRKYGEDFLFEHEPEGVVITFQNPPFAFIYECKSAKQSYSMTAQDELTYKDYIKKKKEEVRALEKSDLKYFVIVSPEFTGDLGTRRENIFNDTQVLPIFLTAEDLSRLGTWACGLPNDIKILIDLRAVFTLKEPVVNSSTIQSYIKGFEKKTKARY